MARKFCRKREVANTDDYIGVAGLAVVVAIHNALKYLVDPDGIGKYVSTYIRGRIMSHYQEDRVVVTPARRQQEFFTLGYLTPISIEPFEDGDRCWWDSRIMEDMVDACPDEFTRKVAHLLLEGYSGREIEVLLDSPHMTVVRARHTLRKLLMECITGDDDEPQVDSND